jgi:aminoglycoside phosphotransferase (APT) family kinase protein
MTKDNLSIFFDTLGLGSLKRPPETVTGGLLHKMYKVTTDKGSYAVKALNPKIMLRPKAIKDIVEAEHIAAALSNNIPAISALFINESYVQKSNGQYYLIYPWVEGRSVKPGEINVSHSMKIGKILAEIHKADLTSLYITREEEKMLNIVDWDDYLQAGNRRCAAWTTRMTEKRDELYDINDKANTAERCLNSNFIVSHRDLDFKNVLWQGENPLIIDWESASYINPMKDLLETALYWSEDSSGHVEKEKFKAFIDAYNQKATIPATDWDAVLYSNLTGKLHWLEYNLKRSLGIEASDEAEQNLGTEQVELTINAIETYLAQLPELKSWLKEMKTTP